jgi:hypothetical protein
MEKNVNRFIISEDVEGTIISDNQQERQKKKKEMLENLKSRDI